MMMRLAIGLAFVALVLVAITPHAGGAPLEGRTPKGVKYRFEQRPKVREIAVTYMFRDPSLATPQGFRNVSYGHPAALVGGSAGEERETVLRKLREAQVQSGTIVPFRGFMGGTLVFPADKLDLAGAVLADVFQKPAYPKQALAERYTNVLKSWRDKFAKEPLNQIQAAAMEVLLVDYPHRRELLIPSKDDIKPPSREDLLAWHKKVIGRNNVIVAVAGNVSEGDAGAFIDRVFGGLPEVEVQRELAEPELRVVHGTIKIEGKVSQVYVRTYALVPRFNEDLEKAIALAVAVQAFGSGPESLLHRSIREDLGAAYSTSAVLTQLTPGVGLFVTTLQLDAEKAPAAIARLKAEYDDLMARGIDESQVKTVTEALKKVELDRPPLSRAVNLLQYEVRNLSTERVRELIKLFDQIRAERINELIREILPKGLLTVVLAPASVSLPADCTIKELAEAAKCMLEKQTSETKRSD
jgi:zinc protease